MKNQFKTIFYYVLIGLFTTQFLVVNVIAGEKKVIEKLDDLPKHTYEIQSTVSELIVYSFFVLPFVLLVIFFQALIEEKYILEKKYSNQYIEYKEKVGMFFPKITKNNYSSWLTFF